MDFTQLLNRAE